MPSRVFCLATILSLGATAVAAVDLNLIVPRVTDTATEAFIARLLEDETLKQADVRLVRVNAGEFGGAPGVARAVLNDAAGLGLLESGTLLALAEDQGRAGDADLLVTMAGSFGMADFDSAIAMRRSVLGFGTEVQLGDLGYVVVSDWTPVPTSLVSPRGRDGFDMAGAKVAVTERGSAERLEAGAAASLTMPPGEMEAAMSRGAIDAAEMVIDNGGSGLVLLEALGGGTLFDMLNPRIGYLVAGEEVWDTLTARQQAALRAAAEAANDNAEEMARSAMDALPALAEAAGMTFDSFAGVLPAPTQAEMIVASFNPPAVVMRNFEEAREKDRHSGLPIRSADDFRRLAAAHELYFITTRNDDGDADLRNRFGNRLDAGARLSCGRIDHDLDTTRRFGDAYSGAVRIGAGGLRQGSRACAEMLDEATGGVAATVLIHGFNNTFSGALGWAIAAAQDLELTGPVVLWSWSSRGTKSGYARDLRGIESNRHRIERFVGELQGIGNVPELTVVAHSMGGLAALHLLENLSDALLPMANLVLVAPDVPHETFKDTWNLPRPAGGLATIYANSNDWAMWVSRGKNDLPIAGDGPPNLLIVQGVDTVDVSEVDNDACWWLWKKKCRNHTHGFDVPRVAQDVSALIRTRQLAAVRGLVPGQGDYYVIGPQ